MDAEAEVRQSGLPSRAPEDRAAETCRAIIDADEEASSEQVGMLRTESMRLRSVEEEAERRLQQKHKLCKLLEIGPYRSTSNGDDADDADDADGGIARAGARAGIAIEDLSTVQRNQFAEIANLVSKINTLAEVRRQRQSIKAVDLAVAAVRQECDPAPPLTLLGTWYQSLCIACDTASTGAAGEAEEDGDGSGGSNCSGGGDGGGSASAITSVLLPKTLLCTSCTLNAVYQRSGGSADKTEQEEELVFGTMLDMRCAQITIKGPAVVAAAAAAAVVVHATAAAATPSPASPLVQPPTAFAFTLQADQPIDLDALAAALNACLNGGMPCSTFITKHLWPILQTL